MDKTAKIVGVAFSIKGEILSLPKPARHCDLFRKYAKQANGWRGDMDYNQGFIDANGVYLHRKAALARAYKTGQIARDFEPRAGILFSEDLW